MHKQANAPVYAPFSWRAALAASASGGGGLAARAAVTNRPKSRQASAARARNQLRSTDMLATRAVRRTGAQSNPKGVWSL
jgi:hypothetical protein